ncbi:MAG: DUF6048 family protein [Sediminicola sp.]|tara:strand:- start:50891 stop:51634 length:744 start_codon:yes stop_codon:yes gene_type:complete
MLRYIISSCLLCGIFLGRSQESIDLQPKDTVVHREIYGLRVGLDLSRLGQSFFTDGYTGLELVGDFRLNQKFYLAAELGNEKSTRQEDLYNYTSSGSYLKLGADYNTYQNWLGMQNSIFLGSRLAYSTFSQTLNDYNIYSSNRYWNPANFVVGSNPNREFGGLSAVWLEVLLGTKVELFAHIYLGASVRLGYLFTNQGSQEFPNLWVPGFNRITDGSNFGASYNYSISYLIPLYKKARKPIDKETDN